MSLQVRRGAGGCAAGEGRSNHPAQPGRAARHEGQRRLLLHQRDEGGELGVHLHESHRVRGAIDIQQGAVQRAGTPAETRRVGSELLFAEQSLGETGQPGEE